MYFCSYVKDIYMFSRKGAKGAKHYVLMFFCQKSLHADVAELCVRTCWMKSPSEPVFFAHKFVTFFRPRIVAKIISKII